MTEPFVLVHLSDPHIGATWAGGDPVAGLAAAVDAVRALGPRPDAVLVSGDLADHAAPAEYEQVRALLKPLGVPVHVLPGNHDAPAPLRAAFGLPGTREDPVQYVAELGPSRLVVLDTTVPGEDPGRLDAGRLEWLDRELRAAPRVPTLLAMHHPPIRTGAAAMDSVALDPADRTALGTVIERHPQVRRLLAGHLHRPMVAELAGRPVLVAPSTYAQARLDLASPDMTLVVEPASVYVHVIDDGELVSYVQRIHDRPAPGSAGVSSRGPAD